VASGSARTRRPGSPSWLRNTLWPNQSKQGPQPVKRLGLFVWMGWIDTTVYQLQVITQPTEEPATTADFKAFCRINTTDEDAIIPGFVTQARKSFEAYTNRAALNQKIRQYVPHWGSHHAHAHWAERLPGQFLPWYSGPLFLMAAPITSIDSVNYYDTSDTPQTVTGYTADLAAVPTPVYLQSGAYPAVNPYRAYPVWVDFWAGAASASVLDPAIRNTVLAGAKWLFDHRGEQSLPDGFWSMVDQYKVGLVGQWGMSR
jgi:hypothetical protein